MVTLKLLNKCEVKDVARNLFQILADNMSKIAPTGNSMDEDYKIWSSNVIPALDKEKRQIILILDDNTIIGYFQYYTNNDLFMMEEIQIREDYHSKGLFRKLYGYIIESLPTGIKYVEAYANKHNDKSKGILKHMGLSLIGEHKGNYHFRGKYSDLIEWYHLTSAIGT